MSEKSNVSKDELREVLTLAIGKKSVILAYVLWFFLGGLGAHRFYLGKIFTGIIMAVLTLVGFATAPIGIGSIILFFVAVWWVIDALLIFLATRKTNSKIENAINRL